VAPSHESRHSHDSEGQDSEVDHEPIQQRYGNPSYSRFRQVASKRLFHSGLMTLKTPLTGEQYVGYYLIQRSKAKKRVLICLIEEKVPCSRSWCHAGHEQYYRLINL
jgi:hypothetical protein